MVLNVLPCTPSMQRYSKKLAKPSFIHNESQSASVTCETTAKQPFVVQMSAAFLRPEPVLAQMIV
jgi:hypothetical protein